MTMLFSIKSWPCPDIFSTQDFVFTKILIKLFQIFAEGKVPQDNGIFPNGLVHRNQRQKLPEGILIHPNWSMNCSGKRVLKFSFLENWEPYH